MPFDHEHAFSFRQDILKGVAWKVGDLPFARKHLFSQSLALVNWDETVKALLPGAVQTTLLHLCDTMPAEWTSIGVDVRSHLTSVFDNLAAFAAEVKRSQ